MMRFALREPTWQARKVTATSDHHGQWTVQPREGIIKMTTNRIGLFTIHASAPILGGEADWAEGNADLTFKVAINEVTTGKSILDPEVHSLVNKGTDGVLTFVGKGHVNDNEVRFEGEATAGNIVVPLVLVGKAAGDGDAERDVTVDGTAEFHDIHIPIPGLGNTKKIDVKIEGTLKLVRA